MARARRARALRRRQPRAALLALREPDGDIPLLGACLGDRTGARRRRAIVGAAGVGDDLGKENLLMGPAGFADPEMSPLLQS